MIVVRLLFLLASTAHVLSEGIGQNYEAHCIEKEKEALLSFKRGIVDPGDILSSWTNSTNQSCCNWRGVTCDNQTNHVVMTDFSGNELSGEIGSSLAELQYLNYLDLSSNYFVRIPKFIGSFKELTYLNLAGNPISGTIPPELGNLTKLQFLSLSRGDNDYNRTLIADNFSWLSQLTSLTTFILKNANFTTAGLQSFKVAPFLPTLRVSHCLLPKVDTSSLSFTNSSNYLKALILQENSLHPTVITWFLNFSSNLEHLSLTSSNIDGSFPDSFRLKNSLKIVFLSENKVGGGVPKSLGNLTNLEDLYLHDNSLGGTLHDFLDDKNSLPALTELHLEGNKLQGPLPNRLSQFPSLLYLYLDGNQLTGPLPDLSLMSNLAWFRAANNKFNSISMESIGEPDNLEILDVSSNSLTGVISEVNLRCPKLRALDLSYNSAVTIKFNSNWVPSFQLSSLQLASFKLGPQFPSWLQTQSNLKYLDISNSDLSGLVPNWFSNITSNLGYLNMSFNLLISNLPYFPLGSYAHTIDLSFNLFDGPIPPFLSNASNLYVSHNKFVDCRSFLCEAKDGFTRDILDFSNNRLSGRLPDCWGNFGTLVFLKLENNEFSGEIPFSIRSLTNIQTLQWRNNNFSGTLPSTLENCTELRVLDLGQNNLEGIIPTWIGERLTSLVFLSLNSNKFYGSIPLSLCYLTQIQILDLSLNDFSGAIPSCIENFTLMVKADNADSTISIRTRAFRFFSRGSVNIEQKNVESFIIWKGTEHEYKNILGLLRIINLSGNKLTGEIPIEVTRLLALVQLNLSRNTLSGAIPENIGNLTKLESQDFSHNKISGRIPTSLAKISSLNYLDLSNNGLSGRIPTGTQLQSFNASTYSMNQGLCGPPLTSSCPGDKTLQDPFASTRENESYDNEDGGEWFDMLWFYIGIGVGFTIGFCGVCGNLLMNTSWRNAYFRFTNSLGDWLYVMIAVKGAALSRKLDWH